MFKQHRRAGCLVGAVFPAIGITHIDSLCLMTFQLGFKHGVQTVVAQDRAMEVEPHRGTGLLRIAAFDAVKFALKFEHRQQVRLKQGKLRLVAVGFHAPCPFGQCRFHRKEAMVMEQRCIKRLFVRLCATVVPAVERKPFLRRPMGKTGGIEFGLQIRAAQTSLQTDRKCGSCCAAMAVSSVRMW